MEDMEERQKGAYHHYALLSSLWDQSFVAGAIDFILRFSKLSMDYVLKVRCKYNNDLSTCLSQRTDVLLQQTTK